MKLRQSGLIDKIPGEPNVRPPPSQSVYNITFQSSKGTPLAAQTLSTCVGEKLPLILHNTAISQSGSLNNGCGADFVKTQQKLPPSLSGVLKPRQRGCSLDGDADRIIYYYMDEHGRFHMLDGDKIATLVALYLGDLLKRAGLSGEGGLELGAVQTAYANGNSTKYLASVGSAGEPRRADN